MINSRFEGVRDLAFPCEGKVPRERRMRWPHFIQNSIESTLKGPFLAEKLQIRSSDTSSVTFVDSFSRSLPLPAWAKNVPPAHFLNASRPKGKPFSLPSP